MRLKKRSVVAAGVTAGLVLGLLSAPMAAMAAPAGAFDSLTLIKQSDGYSFTNNPVDDSGDNNVVAVNDFVGFRIQANTNGAVSDATVTLTKPDCFVWENTVDANLTFTLDGGQTTGTVAHPDANTVTVTWTQAPSGTVLTQPFRVQAGPTCASGTTWTPTLTYTDGSGSHTQSLSPITVLSVAGSDLRITAEGAPAAPAIRWFSNLGNVPAIRQGWRIQLAPETLSSVGYSDPNGNVTFNVTFTGVGSAYELPRFNTGVLSQCWSYVTPSASNNGNYAAGGATQTIAITMQTTGACAGLLTQTNSIYIESFTPLSRVESAGCNVTHGAQVTAGAWVDSFGRPIPDNPLTNNSASVTLQCAAVNYGWSASYRLIAPTVDGVSYDAYPYRSFGAAEPTGDWQNVANSSIGAEAGFMSMTGFNYDNPTLDDFASYHLWDATKQNLDIARLDKAVMGAFTPNSSLDSVPYNPSTYVKECTTGFTGANADSAGTLTWVDCTTLDPAQINGLRFRYLTTLQPYYYNVNFPDVRSVFSQVPFVAVGDPVTTAPTTFRWTSSDFAETNRGGSQSVTIVGNNLLIGKDADVTQVQPEGDIVYTLTPQVAQPTGTFLPIVVPNLQVVDSLDIGVMSVDLSGLDPFWTVTQEAADLGPDGVPYTADDVGGIRLTFTPAGAITTETMLPEIVYTAQMGILLPPPAAPYNATVRNTAVLSADYSSGNRTAAESVVAGTPEAAFFSKMLISDPVIEVEDLPAAWRVHWVNYNNYSLGQGRFVDVFPYDGDGRGTDFTGTVALTQIVSVGSAMQAGTVIELTSDAPGTVGSSPAASTNWIAVDPSDPASWPANPTAIRVTVPNIEASTQGYGAVDLHFEVDGQRKNDIYHNDASATVYNPVQDATVNLGTRRGEPVRVIASSIAGVAWVDRNADGIRQDTEALLPNVPVHLYRDGDTSAPFRTATTDANGAYRFTQLHSSDYQVVFDVDELKAMGYKLTDQSVGSDTTVDSDADVDTGEVDQLSLPRDTDVEHLDAGLLAIGLQAEISADASLTRTYAWDISKAATNRDGLAVDPATGAATIEYSVVTTEGAYTDSNAQLSGEVTVTNPSEEKPYTFTATVAADGTGLTCTVTNGQDREIDPGAILTLPYSCTGSPGDDLDRTLTVTVAATDIDPATGQTVEPVQATADTEYQVNEVNRTVSVTDAATVGGAAQADREFGPYTWSAEGTDHTETYSVDVTVPAGDCLAVDNTATIEETGQSASESLTACLPLDLTIEKNVVTGLQRTYGWGIEKRLANPDVQLDEAGEATLEYEVVVTEGAQDDASWTMSGEVTVSNPNRYKSVDATVTDAADIGGGVSCLFAGGETVTLAAGETRTLPYSCSFASEPAYAGVNTATIAWQSDAAGTSRTLVEDRSAVAAADIREDAWALTEFQKTVSVEDIAEIDGAAQAPREFGPYTWSAEGTEHVETYAVDIAVDAGTCLLIDNTATSVELGADATTQHTLCREAPLSIADPATASLVRTFDWALAKQLVNREGIASDESQESVDAQYAVTVTEGGYTDSAHQLTGQVEITNPNDYRSYTVDVVDTISIDGVECALANPESVVVLANSTVTLPYTCAGDPGETLSGTHGVTVTGADIEPISHEEEVSYAITEVNRTVTVTDDKHTFDPEWRITWSEEGAEHVREYALQVETASGTCQTFENTAALLETGQSSTAGVRICAPDGSSDREGVLQRLVRTGDGMGALLPAAAALLALIGLVIVLRRRTRGSAID